MAVDALSPTVAGLLVPERLQPLGPGRRNEPMRGKLAALTMESLFSPEQVRNPAFAQGCLAGLWLYHDFLDESHNLSQAIDTVEGSYWHGILHRREPDASNAGYWFRRVGDHPIFEALAREAKQLGLSLSTKHWDPFHFIELCEKQRDKGTPEERLLQQVQQKEWDLLFAWCYRHAVGKE